MILVKATKRFDTLRGFYQTLLAECLHVQASEEKKVCIILTDFKLSNREECKVGNSKGINVMKLVKVVFVGLLEGWD